MNAESQNSQKPICVVVDTSVWRAEPLLKTPRGEALVYTLSRRRGFIGLPEVVEIEIKNTIVKAGLDAADKARGALNLLGTITGELAPSLPTAIKLSAKVDDRMKELAPILVREPLTADHARAALAMVNAKLSTCAQNQPRSCA